LSAEAAGVPAEKLGEVRELLPEVRGAAASLAAAGDLPRPPMTAGFGLDSCVPGPMR